MLNDKMVKAFVISNNANASKKFYTEKLGFKLLSEDNYGLEFEMDNALLRISIVTEQIQAAKHTVLGWCVPDIYESLAALKSNGIVFERFGFLEQDADDAWTAPGGTKVAWFKDNCGNLLSIDQKG